MDARLITMADVATRPRAGAHLSDGWDVDTPWHVHDMHQILYAFEGALEVEGLDGRYLVPRQYAMWVPAGAVHRTRIQRIASGSIFFSTDMVQSPCSLPRVVRAPALMREMVLHGMRWPIHAKADPVADVYFDCLARLLGDWLADEVPLALPASDDPRIDAAMRHIRDAVASVTLGDAARAAAMSERSFRRHFTRSTGLTFEDYRRRLRICQAIDALDGTALPIGVIAADVGYDSQAAFAAAFRSAMGISPSEYRKGLRS